MGLKLASNNSKYAYMATGFPFICCNCPSLLLCIFCVVCKYAASLKLSNGFLATAWF
uniref:Uncharacterized protein n=1 Tax=Anguilla anguilla TaxID=7936 RepID=A0A0E9SK08_ANGAN